MYILYTFIKILSGQTTATSNTQNNSAQFGMSAEDVQVHSAPPPFII